MDKCKTKAIVLILFAILAGAVAAYLYSGTKQGFIVIGMTVAAFFIFLWIADAILLVKWLFNWLSNKSADTDLTKK